MPWSFKQNSRVHQCWPLHSCPGAFGVSVASSRGRGTTISALSMMPWFCSKATRHCIFASQLFCPSSDDFSFCASLCRRMALLRTHVVVSRVMMWAQTVFTHRSCWVGKPERHSLGRGARRTGVPAVVFWGHRLVAYRILLKGLDRARI